MTLAFSRKLRLLGFLNTVQSHIYTFKHSFFCLFVLMEQKVESQHLQPRRTGGIPKALPVVSRPTEDSSRVDVPSAPALRGSSKPPESPTRARPWVAANV